MGSKEAHVSTSKYLALILRHKPQEAGITLDEHGWAYVPDLIRGVSKTHKLNVKMLEEIVSTDSKNRYSFNEDHSLIRANQGHSIKVDVELAQADPPAILYHGTAEKYLPSIKKEGLIPKSRLYVHLSTDQETARKVGARHGKPMVLAVDSKAMQQDGYKFFLSQNGVWLTKAVPVEYLSV